MKPQTAPCSQQTHFTFAFKVFGRGFLLKRNLPESNLINSITGKQQQGERGSAPPYPGGSILKYPRNPSVVMWIHTTVLFCNALLTGFLFFFFFFMRTKSTVIQPQFQSHTGKPHSSQNQEVESSSQHPSLSRRGSGSDIHYSMTRVCLWLLHREQTRR